MHPENGYVNIPCKWTLVHLQVSPISHEACKFKKEEIIFVLTKRYGLMQNWPLKSDM
jgi:hypothetical protein